MNNRVAVITRTKNRNIFLRRAIESVLGQVYNDWTMVIVNDGGNKEELEKLVEEYESSFQGRCLVLHNEESLGMEAASNRGIKNSNSEYVVIHDDDDSWHPDFLEKCVSFMDANTFDSVYGVTTHSRRVLEKIKDNQVVIESTEPYNTWLRSITIYRMAASNVFPPISFLYKRSVYDTIGYYRENLPVLGDWEFNLRFIQQFDIALIPEVLANYHHRLQEHQGELGNSVIKDDDRHKFYDSLIRNELLRRDLQTGNLGMGYLVNLVQSFETVHSQIAPIEAILNKLRQSRKLAPLKKIFKAGIS